MRIGILTFHWATNYGAVLQCYALCTILKKLGHDVSVINYKPKKYDFTLLNFIKNHNFLNIKNYVTNFLKEVNIQKFRKRYFQMSHRYYTEDSMSSLQCDALITGSDQVMNPYFLQYGENGASTAYFLGFGNKDIKRIAYAVSFGTIEYPKDLLSLVQAKIARFSSLSVRENSGINIINQMGRKDSILVPDPTILLTVQEYNNIIKYSRKPDSFYFVYILRDCKSIKSHLKKLFTDNEKLVFSKSEGIECWLNYIRSSKGVFTNSYHACIFCIHFHIPFVVVLEQKRNVEMNDRFYTLLNQLDLLDRIKVESDLSIDSINSPIEWGLVDKKLDDFRKIGLNFLKSI